MIMPARDSMPLSQFLAQPDEHLRRLRDTGKPEVLTVGEDKRLVVQDVTAYQRIIDELEALQTQESLRRAAEQKARGEGRPAETFFREIAGQNGIDLGE